MNRLLVLRSTAWLLPLVATYALLVVRRPHRSALAGLLLALVWNGWTLLALNLVAINFGWWGFATDLPLVMGVPIELWLGWTLLWGGVAPLAALERPAWFTVVAFVWLDLIVMHSLEPLLILNGGWLLGEASAVILSLLPGLLLFRWTALKTALRWRVWLQVISAGAIFGWLVASAAMDATGGWSEIETLPRWQLILGIQVALLPVAMGIKAVTEFAERGGGTPIPYDAPTELVSSGPYMYVRNPMQVSMVLLFIVLAGALRAPWMLAAAGVAFLYSQGLAAWHEDVQLSERFGRKWHAYRGRVRPWIPLWRPSVEEEATLLVAFSCGTCREIGRWFVARSPSGLRIAPAEEAGDQGLRRVTYLTSGGYREQGVAAIMRALGHVNLGWALVGWILLLPGIRMVAQLIADVFGPRPHVVHGLPYGAGACRAPDPPTGATDGPALRVPQRT